MTTNEATLTANEPSVTRMTARPSDGGIDPPASDWTARRGPKEKTCTTPINVVGQAFSNDGASFGPGTAACRIMGSLATRLDPLGYQNLGNGIFAGFLSANGVVRLKLPPSRADSAHEGEGLTELAGLGRDTGANKRRP